MYDPNEIAPTVKVRTQDGTEYTAIVTGQALRFPRLVVNGMSCEVSRETLIRCQKEGRPVLI
jgi:hypothetical protein